MTETVYTDRIALKRINGDWYIVEFDGTTEQLSKVVGVEKVFRIKDSISSMRFYGYMNLSGKIYDLRNAENPFYDTPVVLKGTPGWYIPRHENTDLFFVKAWDPRFLQNMPILPDNCKYIRLFKLDDKKAFIFDKSGLRLVDVTKFGTYEITDKTMIINPIGDYKATYFEEEIYDLPYKSDIPGVSMQLMDNEVLKFAKDMNENFERNGENIQYIQLKEPSLTWFKELAKRYVKEHERRPL